MNRLKFENAVLYLLRHSFPEQPGLTSLLKMLYFADHEHYRQFLSPITGARYVALERGPVVDGYKDLFEQMTNDGVLELFEATVLGRKEKKQEYRPLAEPDVSVFSSTELKVLDSVARQYGSETGTALSEKTHLEGPWSLVWDPKEPGLEIPYLLFRWVDNLPDETDLEYARNEIASRPEVLETIEELQSASA